MVSSKTYLKNSLFLRHCHIAFICAKKKLTCYIEKKLLSIELYKLLIEKNIIELKELKYLMTYMCVIRLFLA